jgi:hypothetical protein
VCVIAHSLLFLDFDRAAVEQFIRCWWWREALEDGTYIGANGLQRDSDLVYTLPQLPIMTRRCHLLCLLALRASLSSEHHTECGARWSYEALLRCESMVSDSFRFPAELRLVMLTVGWVAPLAPDMNPWLCVAAHGPTWARKFEDADMSWSKDGCIGLGEWFHGCPGTSYAGGHSGRYRIFPLETLDNEVEGAACIGPGKLAVETLLQALIADCKHRISFQAGIV